MNYKPFDLQKALAGEPVIVKRNDTDEKWDVIKVVYIAEAPAFATVIAVIKGATELKCFFDDGSGDTYSLHMAPQKKTLWVNISRVNGSLFSSNLYDTKEEALRNIRSSQDNYIGTYPIEIEL